jgi:uncharacterized repeat protein (TIGR01451 family)
MPTAALAALTRDLAGTSFDTNPAFTIEGVAADGTTPATADVVSPAAGGRLLYVRHSTAGPHYIVVRGLAIDLTTTTPGTASVAVMFRDADAGPVCIEYSSLEANTDSQALMGDDIRAWFQYSTTAPTSMGEVRYCYSNNATPPAYSNASRQFTMHDCVVRHVGRWGDTYPGRILWTSAYNANNEAGYYHNTVIATAGSDALGFVLQYAATGGTADTVNWHSNLMWLDTTAVSTPVAAVFSGGASSDAWQGTIGYNVIYFGTNVASGDVTAIYTGRWATGGTPKATDVVGGYEQAQTAIFGGPSAAWDWADVNDSGYTIPLPGDYRPIAHRTAGLGGTVPGALPAYSTDYSVSVVVDKSVPNIGDTIRYTLTLGNTGNDATGVVVDAMLPTGVTYASHTASTGTYDYPTGQWDVASLATGATATLLVVATVDQDQAGETITYTVEVTDGDPIPDPDALSDDTDSVSITVVSVSRIPYLDVEPIYAPDLRLEINSSLRAYVNRVRMAYPRFDDENVRWREFATKQFTVATSETVELVTGLENYYYIILQSDEPVDVSVGPSGADRFFPQCTMLMLAPTLAQRIQVRNPGTATATVLITVVDNGNNG